MTVAVEQWKPDYEPWRHGGWYVCNIRYPNGGCGCVSNNFEDKRWRIITLTSLGGENPSFSTRGDAAMAEKIFVDLLTKIQVEVPEAAQFINDNGYRLY